MFSSRCSISFDFGDVDNNIVFCGLRDILTIHGGHMTTVSSGFTVGVDFPIRALITALKSTVVELGARDKGNNGPTSAAQRRQ